MTVDGCREEAYDVEQDKSWRQNVVEEVTVDDDQGFGSWRRLGFET